MLKSNIEFKNGTPYICIDGVLHAPLAYTTYFEERGEYADFINSGYKMFFVNVSFTDLPINNTTGFTPFWTGVFETEVPDYAAVDATVRQILALCPDAFIFPRINVAMPRKWIAEHPYETVATPTGNRESMCSELFRLDGAMLLQTLVEHIRSSDYAHRIAGYQLCGGTTQEWMHHDLFGSFSDMGLEKFRLYVQQKYGNEHPAVPTRADFKDGTNNETVSRYGAFCCETAATTVCHFAKKLKEYICNEQIVGVFYGYHAFVNDYLWGLHGMRFLIDSPYIDFFSSPCAYDCNRNFGVDWGDMFATASVKLHGKLCFIECDIRTYLTRRMQDARPGRYTDDFYGLYDAHGNKTVWCGPETAELSLSALRKAFAHQLVNGSGIWWFDMWGGWYHDDVLLADLAKMKTLARAAEEKNSSQYPSAETVVFIDEAAYLNNPRGSDFTHCVNRTRLAMGNTGIPFDILMTEDADKVLHKYKAAVFTAPLPSESGKNAMVLCEKCNIPALLPDSAKSFFSTQELRDFLTENGVHCYNADGNVIYCGRGFVGIHAVRDGEVTISLPAKYKVKPLFGAAFADCETENIKLFMQKYHTAVFELL